MSFNTLLTDLLFPKKCSGCMKLGTYLCGTCIEKLPVVSSDICPYCMKSSYFGLTHPSCKRPLGLDGLKSIFYYDGLVKKIITQIKYKRVKHAFSDLLHAIPRAKRDEISFYKKLTSDIVMIPVPLHIRRERERGFNQSYEIAQFISRMYSYHVRNDFIKRSKNTTSQAQLSAARLRSSNVRGAFSLISPKDSLLSDQKAVLLIDDVWTTGATLRELCRTIKKHSSVPMYALTLARVHTSKKH